MWLAMLAWWMVPPYRAQIQDHARGPFSWDWRLHRPEAQVCDVRLFDMNRGGAAIERWRLLGFDSPEDMPKSYARVREGQLHLVYASACVKLRRSGDARPHVEAFARCDDDGRFAILDNRERNVCEAPRTSAPTLQARHAGSSKP